jgi:hypothetical protein
VEPPEAHKEPTEAQLAATNSLAPAEGPKRPQECGWRTQQPQHLRDQPKGYGKRQQQEPAELKEPEEPGEPEEPKESAELKEQEDPGGPEEPCEPEEPKEPEEPEEYLGWGEWPPDNTAAKADTVGVRREAVRFAEDAKMDPSNCLMETLVLRENQEGIRIRRSPGDYAEHLPWVLEHVFLQTLCGPGNDEQGRCPTAMCEETTADA